MIPQGANSFRKSDFRASAVVPTANKVQVDNIAFLGCIYYL